MNRVRRRILAFSGTFALSLLAPAQHPAKLRRIGVIATTPIAEDRTFKVFVQRIRELGYVEGKKVAIEHVSADSKNERLPAIAAELVRRNVDVILTRGGTPSAIAARNATRTIPIVFTGVADPVGQGLVASLARPGGNVTGMSLQHPQTAAKTLELMKEVVPAATRIALLANPTNESHALVLKEMQAAAQELRLEISIVHARTADDIEQFIAEVKRLGAQGLVVISDSMFGRHSARLSALAPTHRLPAIGGSPVFTERGGLLSYGGNRREQGLRAAALADRILKGAKPADLPVEQPTKFELVLNMKTARAHGITFPQTVLLRADRVIE